MKKISILLLLPVLFWTACLPDKQQIPASVTAITPEGAQVAGYKTCFKATTTGAAAYLWEFGDGTRSSQAEPCHVYSTSGTFTVRLTLNNDASVSMMKSVMISAAPASMEMTGGAMNWHLMFHNELSSGASTSPVARPDTVMTVYFPDAVTAIVAGKLLQYASGALQNDSVRTFYREEDNDHGHSNAYTLTYRHHTTGDTILYKVREGVSAGGANIYDYQTP
ncbi:MAG: PKD domain-containing protein [Chitinophagaceae bacterium]|nr:PKD domain-containing protein [Chitinophagaceae bacterium]